MGILDFVEKAAGALAADKGLEAVDPNANLLEKAAAAVAGYEGVAAVKDHFSKADQPAPDQPAPDAPATDPTDPAPQDNNQ